MAPTSAAGETFAADAQSRLNHLIDRMHGLGGLLGRTADAAFGSLPECSTASACAPERSGQFGEVLDLVDRLAVALTRAEIQADRLASVA